MVRGDFAMKNKGVFGLAAVLVLALSQTALAKLASQAVEYRHHDTVMQGYLAYDDTVTGKRPGVLVVHEWWGLNEFAKERANKLAEMGYVALAVDMYGKGQVTQDPEEARKLAGHVRSTPLMRERAKAGLEILHKHSLVDPQKLAAIGFCFGGTTVLELAYSGADVKGVVSFHGGLTAAKPEDRKNIKASFLVLHGADDPLIKPEEAQAFQNAMRQAGADWQMVYYGGAVHSFANPKAGSDKSKGVAYDSRAASRSWEQMRLFLKELFQIK
jgi:dienelactone hydrolase